MKQEKLMISYDVIIIGAGASGLMCGIEAGKKGKKTLILDHTKKLAEKIRISGGGKCNFTNMEVSANNYICNNPHFVKSALAQYTNWDFIAMLGAHNINYHEKTLGQLFCDNSAQDIIDILLEENKKAKTDLRTRVKIKSIEKENDKYIVTTDSKTYSCNSLVIATGGLSIPKIGASNFGYEIAKKFDLNIIPPAPALVPFTFDSGYKELSGISVNAEVSCNGKSFRENILFTHKGLSGPVILQISSYWNKDDSIIINMAPNINVFEFLKDKRNIAPKQNISTILSELFPKRLAQHLAPTTDIGNASNTELEEIANNINRWEITPTGTEGYKIAEVTRGGVDTDEVSSKTFESKKHKGLFFIGEVLDVTGHLGGYNFQWAWSSGFVAGNNV